jgi:hypothetical protein
MILYFLCVTLQHETNHKTKLKNEAKTYNWFGIADALHNGDG